MVKTNARPERRPKRGFTAYLGCRLVFLVGIPTVYCLVAAGGTEAERHISWKEQTGNP
jgi:hypothetical protein